jgi:hypothetical protein
MRKTEFGHKLFTKRKMIELFCMICYWLKTSWKDNTCFGFSLVVPVIWKWLGVKFNSGWTVVSVLNITTCHFQVNALLIGIPHHWCIFNNDLNKKFILWIWIHSHSHKCGVCSYLTVVALLNMTTYIQVKHSMQVIPKHGLSFNNVWNE